ncbi:hypothetical protein [Robbsia andropogonis]|uniref:hypothetical protein n=1 Tax=Robbsia andropogonis TaxID=28092 RepID=UPI002A6B32ED|nr:hypothetical protein [Robbsia andropogonis]
MESWNVNNYDEPRLVPLSAQLDRDGKTILMAVDNEEFEINASEIAAPILLDSLLQMRDPKSQIWTDIKEGLALPWQSNLAKQLDELSLVESKPPSMDVLPALATRYDALVSIAAQTIVKLAENQKADIQRAISCFAGLLDAPVPRADAFSVAHIPTFNGRNDFAIQTFFLQKLYVEENLPIVIPLWRQILAIAAGQLGARLETDRLSMLRTIPSSSGFYCVAHVEAYLLCLVDLVRLSSMDDGRSQINARTCFEHADTGLNFMRRAEAFALSSLSNLGESRFSIKINDPSAKFGPVVQGLFIEQYHVTQRFVEIIAPLMIKRTRTPIKQRVYRYFQEEIGHEAFERATCIGLGVTAAQLDSALPLPLFQAYVDAFTVIGRFDAVGYMASIMVTEGMLGIDNPVHHRLEELANCKIDYQAIAKRHDELNVELNHASLSRLFFEEVGVISPDAQNRALENLAFLIELNFRAMDQAADFYGKQETLRMCSLETYAASYQ